MSFLRKMQEKKAQKLEKLLCLGTLACFLSSPAVALAEVADKASPDKNSATLFQEAEPEDISKIVGYLKTDTYSDPVMTTLTSKEYKLSRFEVLIMSELIKQDLEKRIKNNNERISAVADLVDLQNKYGKEYEELFKKIPDVIAEAKNVQSSEEFAGISGSPELYDNGVIGSVVNMGPQDYADAVANGSMGLPTSFGETPQMGMGRGYVPRSSSPNEEIERIRSESSNPEEFVDNMSLLNIRPEGVQRRDNVPKELGQDAVNMALDFNSTEDVSKIEPNMSEPLVDDWDAEMGPVGSISDVVRAEFERTSAKAKDFYVTLTHHLRYVDEKGEGNVPFDTSKVDDFGNYYELETTDQYQLEQSLELGFGFKVSKALDLVVSLLAKNEDGIIGKKGTKFELGNVFFKFRPDRLEDEALQKLAANGVDPLAVARDPARALKNEVNGVVNNVVGNVVGEVKQGVLNTAHNALDSVGLGDLIIADGGRYIGKSLGHSTSVGTNISSGDINARIGNERISYSRANGLSIDQTGGKYYIGLGKLSLDFSSYTLQLSDVKAVEVGYNDANHSLVFVYARPNVEREVKILGETYKEEYKSALWAAQYVARNMFPFMDITFNFAQSKDRDGVDSSDYIKQKTTAYSVVLKSKNLPNTSFAGEFAHATNVALDNPNLKLSGNADYFDIQHKFSRKLSGNLHLINIDGTYDASRLVGDNSGDNLLTTNQGNGLPDYLYEANQKGLDLTFNYKMDDTTTLGLGYSRYSRTTENNSYTHTFLTLDKKWDFNRKDGSSIGTLSLNQRLEFRDVKSNLLDPDETYKKKISDTTISFSGEPWKDGEVSIDEQYIRNNIDGNENRFDMTVAHHFYPIERVTITPKVEYERKKGTPGKDAISLTEGINDEMDSTKILGSLVVGYEVIPDELTVNLLFSKEKYDIIRSELDESTLEKIDGEKRDVTGVGIGFVYEPKKWKGLSLGMSYRRDKVKYYLPEPDISHQNVWELNASYEHAFSDKVRASISYDYRSARDKLKPIYDTVTRTISVDINADISANNYISIQHSYESQYKPLDAAANRKVRTTVVEMHNKF